MSFKTRSPIPVIEGGSGVITNTTAYGVLCAGTTATGAIQNAGAGSAGEVLTSNGAGALPTFQAGGGGGVTEIDGNSGSATPTAGVINLITADTTLQFQASGDTVSLGFDLNNLILGTSAPSLSGATNNVGLGQNVMFGITSASENTAIGYNAGVALSDNIGNCLFGFQAGKALNGQPGNSNTLIGPNCGYQLINGDSNIAIGSFSGYQWTSTESNNIAIGNGGVTGDSNTMRLGASGSGPGQVAATYIGGIAGVATSNSEMVTIDIGTGQMGSTTIPTGTLADIDGNSGTATPSSGTVTITTGSGNVEGTSLFTGSGSTLTLSFSDVATGSTGLGTGALENLAGGLNNFAFGINALHGAVTGEGNCGIGLQAGFSITSGNYNVAIGKQPLLFVDTGSYNVVIGGNQSGVNYSVGSESSNILIGNVPGVTGESNKLRIGSATGTGVGELDAAYIQGIAGVSVANQNLVTINTSTGQMGSISASSASVWATAGGAASTVLSSAGGTTWIAPFGLINSTKGLAHMVVPVSGTVSAMYVEVYANTSTTSVTVTLNVNGSNSSLVATVPGLNTGFYSDLTHSVAVSAGDTVQFEVQSSTVGALAGTVSVKFVA